MTRIHDYDFHPPDEVRVFSMPASGVRRLDDDEFVAEVRYGDITVRHYAFRDHWFKVNCTTDPRAVIERGELVAFLAGCHPLDGAPAPPAPDEQRVLLSAVPLLRPEARPSW